MLSQTLSEATVRRTGNRLRDAQFPFLVDGLQINGGIPQPQDFRRIAPSCYCWRLGQHTFIVGMIDGR